MSAPEIAIGWAVDDAGDHVVRLVFAVDGGEQCVADLLPESARAMGRELAIAADRTELRERQALDAAGLLLRDSPR